jgi:predicted DNA-binding transcriptional regulator AlpA
MGAHDTGTTTLQAQREAAVAEGFASVPQAMEFLSLGRTAIYQLMEDGDLQYAQVLSRRRITWQSLRAYAASCLQSA